MRNLVSLLIVSIAMLLTSCYDDDSKPEYEALTVDFQFNTSTKAVDLSELEDFSDYQDHLYVVNSLDELPADDNFDMDEILKADIDFTNYSLIVVYNLVLGDVISYQYRWKYNNWRERYEATSTFVRKKDSEYVNGEVGRCTYVRGAFLVKHIPSESLYVGSMAVYEK
jgi:hypothetical protein